MTGLRGLLRLLDTQLQGVLSLPRPCPPHPEPLAHPLSWGLAPKGTTTVGGRGGSSPERERLQQNWAPQTGARGSQGRGLVGGAGEGRPSLRHPPEQGAHAGLTEAVPALGLLGAAEHQAALLTLVLVLHSLHEAFLVAALLGHQHGRPSSALGVQLQRRVGRHGTGRIQLLTGLHPRRRGSIRAGTTGDGGVGPGSQPRLPAGLPPQHPGPHPVT